LYPLVKAASVSMKETAAKAMRKRRGVFFENIKPF
jgi:hypothetical protein